MKLRHLVIATALSASALPAFAGTTAQDSMIQACGRAFAAKLGLATGDAPGYKLTNLLSPGSEPLENIDAVDFKLDMVARAAKTGTPLAHAVCTVSRHGSVISLTEEHLRSEAVIGAMTH
jgi:hypothetical protein